jgi:PKD repeat protein
MPAGQTRLVLSSATTGSNVGSPLHAVGDATSWNITAEVNNPANNGVGANEYFFNIDNGGQLTVLQPLSRMFPGATVTATLTILIFDDMGNTDTETVDITILEDVAGGQTPSIPSGQIRNVLASSAVGDNVGDVLDAAGTPTSWTITDEVNWIGTQIGDITQNERFFDIDNSGQLTILQPLERFFPALIRADQVEITLTITAFNANGSDTEDVTIFIIEGAVPIILGGQRRVVVTDASPGASVGDPLTSIGDPTYWTIVDGMPDLDNGAGGFNPAGAFSIDASGQVATTLFLDQFFYTANPTTVTLTVLAGNTNGASDTVQIEIDIVVVGSVRCGTIPAQQTRFISSIASAGETAGFAIDSHGIDSMWIDAAWITNTPAPTDVSTFFTVETNGGTLGQLIVVRDLSLVFDPAVITLVQLQVVGHVFVGQCPTTVEETVFLYVLPEDAGPTGPGGGTGGGTTTEPDFSSFVDDPALLSCIQESLGLSGSDPLTAGDIVATTHLDCACRNDDAISDLDGIHLFTSLTELNLSNNLIEDIRPLAGLDQLTDLRLAGNLINDITTSNPLASMVNMMYLDLSQNQIQDTGAFSTMSNIVFLSLSDNEVCDIGSLAALAALAPDAGINTGDTIYLDNNHLLNTQAQTDLGILEAAGAAVFAFGNDNNCPVNLSPLVLPSWPLEADVIDYTQLLNFRAPCN